MHTVKSPRRGFSLIELLVVIGIIAMLLGVLLPVLSGARKQAKKLACKSRLYDVGRAFAMYQNEFNAFPPARYAADFVPDDANGDGVPDTPGIFRLLPEYLQPYVSRLERDVAADEHPVFTCPADEIYAPQYRISFSYYQELGFEKLENTFFYKILGSASAVPVLWDAQNFHGGEVPFNWLYADGHVDQFLKDVGEILTAAGRDPRN